MNEKIKKTLHILLILICLYIIVLLSNFFNLAIKYLFDMIEPFLISFAIAYLINPLVLKLDKLVKKRTISVVITLSVILVAIFLIVKFSLPILENQLTKVVNEAPRLIGYCERKLEEIISKFDKNYEEITLDNILMYVNDTYLKIELIPKKVIDFFSKYGNIFAFVPILTFYFSLEFENIKIVIKKILLKKNYQILYKTISEINTMLLSYIKGYLLVILILFSASSIAMKILDIKYAFIFGLIIGLTDIIPFIGPYIGGSIPVIYTLSTDNSKTIYLIITIVLIQIIESNILTPNIQSHQVNVHPILILLGLTIFGSLFGFIGMIIATPLVSSIKIVYTNFKDQFKVLKI